MAELLLAQWCFIFLFFKLQRRDLNRTPAPAEAPGDPGAEKRPCAPKRWSSLQVVLLSLYIRHTQLITWRHTHTHTHRHLETHTHSLVPARVPSRTDFLRGSRAPLSAREVDALRNVRTLLFSTRKKKNDFLKCCLKVFYVTARATVWTRAARAVTSRTCRSWTCFSFWLFTFPSSQVALWPRRHSVSCRSAAGNLCPGALVRFVPEFHWFVYQ